jgi:spermidine/putrescine transport system substrate-binding protein
MASGGISRRSVLRGGGAAAFAGLSVAALGLPFFDVEGAQQNPRTCRAGDESSSDPRLLVSNWPGYIDPRRFEDNTRDLFERETGLTVRYTDDVNDNAEFYAKVRSQLGSCEAIDRDIMVLTDWMAARMIGLGWTQPLAKDNVPNLHRNLIKPLRGVQWDPDLEFHAPWQSGLTGIAYNAAETSEVGSFQDLITRPDLKGRITLLSEMRDTMAFMLRLEGADPDDFSQDQWDNAIDSIRKVVDSGQVRSFTGNDYIQDLSNGNVLACEAWSGDVIQAQFDNPDIRFVVPEEGLALWSDNMLVPNLAAHQANAEAWIDFYYDPENAARLAAWVNYICPVEGARDAMEKIDPSLVDNKLIFPDEEALADTFDFMPLDDRQSIEYERDWTNVTAG